MQDQMAMLFENAFQEFRLRQRANIQNGVSERNLCAHLGYCLECAKDAAGLGGYFVDPEYNRNENGRVKTILNDKMEVVPITCDLILHSRGTIPGRDNLIAIEMKKAGRSEEDKSRDRVRLRALTKASYDDIWSADGKTFPKHVCGYVLGVLIELDVRKMCFEVEEFRRGNFVRRYAGNL